MNERRKFALSMKWPKLQCLRVTTKAFISSQLQYCLIWKFYSRKLKTKINKMHERAFRITYRDQECSFEDLIELHNSVFVHQENLQVLTIEVFNTKHGLHPSFMSEALCPQANQK